MSQLDVQVGGEHYKTLPIQPVEFCHRNRLGACESAVVKYVCRHKSKNGRQDLEKAIHYLQLLLEMEYPEEKKPAKKQYIFQYDADGTGRRLHGFCATCNDNTPAVLMGKETYRCGKCSSTYPFDQ